MSLHELILKKNMKERLVHIKSNHEIIAIGSMN